MNPLLSILRLLLWPLHWLRRLMSSQVRLRWQAGKPRLVFEPPGMDPPAAAAKPAAPKAEGRRARSDSARQRSRRSAPVPSTNAPSDASPGHAEDATPVPSPDADPMHAELHRLLAQHGATRKLMRHLAYLERTLRLAGVDALPGLPLDVLKKSLAQLEDLVSDWSSPGLAQLRLQLTMVVADKEDASREFHPSIDVISDFGATRRLQVSEASPSDFEAAAQAWGSSPAPEAPAHSGASQPVKPSSQR